MEWECGLINGLGGWIDLAFAAAAFTTFSSFLGAAGFSSCASFTFFSLTAGWAAGAPPKRGRGWAETTGEGAGGCKGSVFWCWSNCCWAWTCCCCTWRSWASSDDTDGVSKTRAKWREVGDAGRGFLRLSGEMASFLLELSLRMPPSGRHGTRDVALFVWVEKREVCGTKRSGHKPREVGEDVFERRVGIDRERLARLPVVDPVQLFFDGCGQETRMGWEFVLKRTREKANRRGRAFPRALSRRTRRDT